MTRVALIAHDAKKPDLLEFARAHEEQLRTDELIATGTTGQRLVDETDLKVERKESGPLDGDLMIGSEVAAGKLDGIVFLRDPLEPSHTSPITRRCCGSVTFATRRSRRTSPPQRSSSRGSKSSFIGCSRSSFLECSRSSFLGCSQSSSSSAPRSAHCRGAPIAHLREDTLFNASASNVPV